MADASHFLLLQQQQQQQQQFKPGQFSCIACHQAKRACDKRHPCGRCVKQRIECVMQTRGRGRPPRAAQQESLAASLPSSRGSRTADDGRSSATGAAPSHQGVPPAAIGTPIGTPAAPQYPAVLQAPPHGTARSVTSSLSGTSEGSTADELSSEGEECDSSAASVSRSRGSAGPTNSHPPTTTIVARAVSIAPPVEGDTSQKGLIKAAFVACARSLCQIREEGMLDWAKAACLRSVLEYIFVMAGEPFSWASFSTDLGPQQPLPPEIVGRNDGLDSASWAAELMFVPDSHSTRFILGTLDNPVNKEVRCNKAMGDQFITTAELKREAQGLLGFFPVVLARLMRPDSVGPCYDLLMEALFAQEPGVREAVAMLRNRHGIFVRSLLTARLHWLRQTCVLVVSFRPNAFVGVAGEPGTRRVRGAPVLTAAGNGVHPGGENGSRARLSLEEQEVDGRGLGNGQMIL